MIVYADTSWWVAYKWSDDSNRLRAIALFDRWEDARVVWTPWQRVEVFNALRQLERRGAMLTSNAREFIRILEQEVRLGYWPHVEFDWRDAVRAACELSAELSLGFPMRGMDLFNVAIAIAIGAEALLTFDSDQKAFAEAAGLRVLRLTSQSG